MPFNLHILLDEETRWRCLAGGGEGGNDLELRLGFTDRVTCCMDPAAESLRRDRLSDQEDIQYQQSHGHKLKDCCLAKIT
jgi:hypothetical protein